MSTDVFVEHMVRRQHTVKTRLIQLGVLLAVPVLTLAAMTFPITQMLVPFVFLGGCYGAWQLFIRQNVEYEYIVTNGEVDVDKISARRSRKRLLTVDCRNFEILAPAVAKFEREMNSQSIVRRVDASSSVQSENRWFAIFNDKEGKRTILFFDPDRRMLEAFRPQIPRKIQQL